MEIGVPAMDHVSPFLTSRIDGEASSPLAINVYSTLAKLHRHSLIPFLPRIMSSVLASLSSSAQLHFSCTQVVSALAMHTIDSSRDPVSNEDALRSLCRPLLSVLSTPHPPHLASGAACCLQSLVESSPWRCAPLDLQEHMCAKAMQALADASLQTVSHMNLMRALSKTSSGVVIQSYGAQLLASGMDILQNSKSTAKRVAAAQLLESVLKIADAELLDLDISPIVGVLQECQQDKVAGVRTAAADALKTASTYASSDKPCNRLHVPAIAEKRAKKRFSGLQPAAQSKSLSANSTGGGQARITRSQSTPSSISSDNKWLRRLPLAPLQQFSTANSTSSAPRCKQTVPSRLSDCKENVAPAYMNRVPTASRDKQPRRAWISKKDSPSLWPQSLSAKSNEENWGWFDSPHTPIVPLRGEKESEHKDSSVTTLLEKHFGKQRNFLEDEIDASLSNGSSDVVRCSRNEIFDQDEEHSCSDGEAFKCLYQDSDQSSTASSPGTDLCCGAEGIYSPDKESSSDCESSSALSNVSNMQNEDVSRDLMSPPRRLVRSLQFFDDDSETRSQQENQLDFDGGTLDGKDCSMLVLGQTEDVRPDESGISSTPTGCESGSESCLMFSKGDTQGNLNSTDSSSLVKRCVCCSRASSVMKNLSTFELTSSGQAQLKDAACHHESVHRSFGIPHDARSERIVPDVELKSSIFYQHTYVCSRVKRNICLVLLLVVCAGLFVAGLTIYMESLEASILLVPT